MTSKTTTQTITGGACPNCGHYIAQESTTAKKATCPKCSTAVALTLVIGTHNKAVPCDDRCQYAWGPWCSCSCGGANHRRGYIDVEMVPAWILQRDADRIAKKEAVKVARAERVRASNADHLAAQIEAHPELDDLRAEGHWEVNGSPFASDMRHLVLTGQPLTPAQLYRTVNMVKSDRIRARVNAEREAQRAAELAERQATAQPCPTGRTAFAGTIIAVATSETRWGVGWRMLVKADAGWQVWVTIPKAILLSLPATDFPHDDQYQSARKRAFRGRRVELTATVEPALATAIEGTAKNPEGSLAELAGAGSMAA